MAVLTLAPGLRAGRETLGGKAAGIVRMLELGIPVPPAFVITTDECTAFHTTGERLPDAVVEALPAAVAELEQAAGGSFGRGPNPLLVSVRSGAPTSMPGMMDTILNLGMTDEVQAAFGERTGDASFAADLARRFAQQFAHIVGCEPPADPWQQLHAAIGAVFASWMSRRAVTYRRERGISEHGGTAVTVQAMVFGNLDERSGTGVLFSRNPITGDPEPYGEYLPRGQGEDVVSGSHDPLGLDALPADLRHELFEIARRLERAGADVQDIEFTVQSGKLWLLQTRAAKRTASAAVRLAVALQREGHINADAALSRVTADQVAILLREHLAPQARATALVLAAGRPASPGIATGTVVTDVDEAEDRASAGEQIILARQTTNPDDVHAMAVVAGIVTEVGGATSHAAVVSRELDVPCIVGCGLGTVTPLAGRMVTLDADTGDVLDGELPTIRSDDEEDPDLATLKAWARERGATGDSLIELLQAYSGAAT